MTNRERERRILDFKRPEERGPVEETFYPWSLTADRFVREGLQPVLVENIVKGQGENEKYFRTAWGRPVMEYEQHLGFDPVRRVSFMLPFRVFDEEILEDTAAYTIVRRTDGRRIRRDKASGQEHEYRQIVTCENDWEILREHAANEQERYFSADAVRAAFAPLKAGHDAGEYSIRLNLEGFFWVPRELLGVEEHLYAFYDEPVLLHSICDYMLEIYSTSLGEAVRMLEPDVVYIMEDLSGKNGSMLSGEHFDEFVGAYYKKLNPLLKQWGAGNVFVDTDGVFSQMIPNFIAAGVDGFLPMDVNAGMDIVKVREQFASLKFIGGFNKLCIAEGKDAIDCEFERILPVIRGGGYIPGADHQVSPETSLANYCYYIKKLSEVMRQAGLNCSSI